MSTLVILRQMSVIAVLVLIGVYLHKKGIADDNTANQMSVIVMDIVNPALILSSIVGGNITATRRDLLTAIGIGLLLYSLLCVLGVLIPNILPIEKNDRKYYNLMTVYTNVGFIGIPLARAVLPDEAMLYVIVCNIIYCLLFYTHGVSVLGGKEDAKPDLKKLFSNGTIMAFITLVVFWFNIKLPEVISLTITYLGNATVFLSMALLGITIARSSVKDSFRDKNIWIYILLRMVMLPIALTLILKSLHLPEEMTGAFCLMASMPVANLPLIQAEKVGADTKILSGAIMVTTLVCFVTVSIIMAVLF